MERNCFDDQDMGLFVDYFTTLSTSQTAQRQMVGKLVSNELHRMWKEGVAAQ
jgi:hypothetical protein